MYNFCDHTGSNQSFSIFSFSLCMSCSQPIFLFFASFLQIPFICTTNQDLASFPGPRHVWLHKDHRGPGIFSHVHDVKGRKVVRSHEKRYQTFPTSFSVLQVHVMKSCVGSGNDANQDPAW